MRHALIALLATGLAAACAPARAAPPPVPELVGAEPVAVHEQIDSLDPVGGGPGTERPELAPTAGAAPDGHDAELTGWAAFERSLESSILDNGSFAFSAAVVVDGELVRSFGRGELVPGEDRPAASRPVDAVSRFRVASISKIVTAVVVLQLVDEGLIGLDEPIGARLAAHLGVEPVAPSIAALTPEHLLGHVSGLGAFRNSFFAEQGLTCADAGAAALRGTAAPGAGMSYSNMNSCLAHLLIEAVTGQSYADAVHQRLLAPLGITDMRIAGTYDVGPDEAVHFSRPGRNYMEALGGAGAWIANAADIARIVDALDPATPGWRPLSDELLVRMRQPPLGRSGGYGLGLILYPDGSVGHTGTLESTHAMVVSRPDGVTWAVLVNGEHPRESAALRTMVDRAFAVGFPDG